MLFGGHGWVDVLELSWIVDELVEHLLSALVEIGRADNTCYQLL